MRSLRIRWGQLAVLSYFMVYGSTEEEEFDSVDFYHFYAVRFLGGTALIFPRPTNGEDSQEHLQSLKEAHRSHRCWFEELAIGEKNTSWLSMTRACTERRKIPKEYP